MVVLQDISNMKLSSMRTVAISVSNHLMLINSKLTVVDLLEQVLLVSLKLILICRIICLLLMILLQLITKDIKLNQQQRLVL